MIHLKKKQEEVLRTKEQKRQLLEKRIESRNRAKTNAKGHLTSASKGVPVAEDTSAPKATPLQVTKLFFKQHKVLESNFKTIGMVGEVPRQLLKKEMENVTRTMIYR